MKLIRRHYEEGYHQLFLTREAANSQRNHARLRLLLNYQTGGSLLEVGCGMGGFLRQAESFFNVEGVDVSRAAIEAIRPHFGDRVSVFNIEQRPLSQRLLPRGGYAAIAVFNVLEHLHQPARIVEKLYRTLSPGGVLLGSVPNNFGLVGGVNTRLGNFFDRTHISTLPPAAWRRIFQHAGFQQVTFFGEVTLGPNRCRYLSGRFWPYISFNLMFACQK